MLVGFRGLVSMFVFFYSFVLVGVVFVEFCSLAVIGLFLLGDIYEV